MSVLQNVRKKYVYNETVSSVAREVAVHIAYFVSGLLVSRGALFGSMSPFGASFAAAIPFSYMPSGLIGSIIGYLLLKGADSFRYIAVVIAIGALRWVLNEFKRVSNSRFYPSVIAFIPVFATGVALTFSGSSEITEVTRCLIEAVLSAAAAYFMSRTATLSSGKKSLYSLSQQEIACLAMSGCILLLSFGALTVGNVSLGRILAVLVVLLCARYGFVAGGSISGIATGIMFSLSSNEMIFLCSGYAFGGLMGGLFAPVGKLAVAFSMLLCNVIMAFSSNDKEMIFAIFVECAVAGAAFMLLPSGIGSYVANVFSDNSSKQDSDAVRRSVTMRLSFASKALSGVSSCVNSVSNKLSRLYSPNARWIYDNAANATCTRCGMRYYCLERMKERTYEDFDSLTDTLKQNGFVKEKDIEDNFSKKCCRMTELAYSINQSYKEYLSCEAARRRITQVRSVVAGQFSGLSDILQDLCEEFEEYDVYDTDSSDRVLDVLSSMGLTVVDSSCRISKGKGMIVEIELVLSNKTNISKSQLTHEVSRCCGRRFESPTLSFAGDRVRIVLCERPAFDVEIGSAQHVYQNGELCGDCLNYFNNGMGSTVMILSDGMGTGGRAAVDSNMAVSIMTKLLKAGLSYDCTLQVVNSSLMIKSEDETMATLDVADVNLFSGKVKLLKAGACMTYIVKNSHLIRKDIPSLPVGILSETSFKKEDITLSEHDMILMVSDGALIGDDKWIEKLLLSWRDKPMEDLASAVVDEAIKRRNDSHDDDITALALRILEN